MTDSSRRRTCFLPDGRLTTEWFVEYHGRPFRAVKDKKRGLFLLSSDSDDSPGPEWSKYRPTEHSPVEWRRTAEPRDVDAYFSNTLWANLDGYRFEVGWYFVGDDTVSLRGGTPVDASRQGVDAAFDLYNHPYLERHEGGAYFTGEVPLVELSDFVSERLDLQI